MPIRVSPRLLSRYFLLRYQTTGMLQLRWPAAMYCPCNYIQRRVYGYWQKLQCQKATTKIVPRGPTDHMMEYKNYSMEKYKYMMDMKSYRMEK